MIRHYKYVKLIVMVNTTDTFHIIFIPFVKNGMLTRHVNKLQSFVKNQCKVFVMLKIFFDKSRLNCVMMKMIS